MEEGGESFYFRFRSEIRRGRNLCSFNISNELFMVVNFVNRDCVLSLCWVLGVCSIGEKC